MAATDTGGATASNNSGTAAVSTAAVDAGELTVSHDPAGAVRARHRVAEFTLGHGVAQESVHDVAVVTGELVNNAVAHTRNIGGVRLRWQLHAEQMHICVYDGSSQPPVLRRPRAEQSGGRGLPIVNALSVDWGCAPCGKHGKRVCAIVAVRRRH